MSGARGDRRVGPARRLARLVALLGAIGAGWLLFGRAPKEVVLVYDVGPASALEVALRRDGEVVRRAQFSPRAGTVRHEVRLPEGVYRLEWRAVTPSGARTGDRVLEIRESGTIVLPLGR